MWNENVFLKKRKRRKKEGRATKRVDMRAEALRRGEYSKEWASGP